MKANAKMLLGLLGAGCATTTTARLHLAELQTVPRVDLGRYVGTWFEIASFPQSFQRGCTATTATYTLRGDGQIDVVNRCRKGSLDGPEKVARGRARVVDRATNAKLEVSFFRPFWGDYWIIDLGADYEYSVVGHPGRDYLWILSRTPTMEPELYASIVHRLQAQGYETHRLQKTTQPGQQSGGASCPADRQLARALERTCRAPPRPRRSEAVEGGAALDIFGRDFVIVTRPPVAIFEAVRAGGAPEEP